MFLWSHTALITHWSHNGDLDLHTNLACVINHMWAPYLYLPGVVLLTVIDAFPSSRLSAQPNLHSMRNTCVSTAMCGSPKTNLITMSELFLPTPGNVVSSFCVLGTR